MQVMTSAALVLVMASVSLAAMAIGRSTARGARPAVTYATEAPASWAVIDPDGANGRSEPGYAHKIVHEFAFGEVVIASGRVADVQDVTWREVSAPSGDSVWVRAVALGIVGDGTITPPVTIPPVTVPPVTTPPTTTPPTTTPPTTQPRPIFDDEAPGLWDVTGISRNGVLNVRTGPGVAHAVVARFGADAGAIRSTGNIARVDGALWRQVEYRDGARGWVNAAFLVRHVAPAPVPVFGTETPGRWDVTGIAPGSVLNVRTAPGITGDVVARLAANAVDIRSTGKTATIEGALWREVEYRTGSTGWVSARYLAVHVTVPPVPAPVYGDEAPGLWDVQGIAAGGQLNVRSQPGPAGSVIGRLASDASGIPSTGKFATVGDALWRQVRHAAGATGWVLADHLAVHALPANFQEVVDAFLTARVAGEGAEAYLARSAVRSIADDESVCLYGDYTEAELLKARNAAEGKWELDVRLVDNKGKEVFETFRVSLKKTGAVEIVRVWITPAV